MLVIIDQVDVEAQDENFHPPFLVGDPGVLDPNKDVVIPSYGITDEESTARIKSVYSLWSRSDGVSGGRMAVEAPG